MSSNKWMKVIKNNREINKTERDGFRRPLICLAEWLLLGHIHLPFLFPTWGLLCNHAPPNFQPGLETSKLDPLLFLYWSWRYWYIPLYNSPDIVQSWCVPGQEETSIIFHLTKEYSSLIIWKYVDALFGGLQWLVTN